MQKKNTFSKYSDKKVIFLDFRFFDIFWMCFGFFRFLYDSQDSIEIFLDYMKDFFKNIFQIFEFLDFFWTLKVTNKRYGGLPKGKNNPWLKAEALRRSQK